MVIGINQKIALKFLYLLFIFIRKSFNFKILYNKSFINMLIVSIKQKKNNKINNN